MYFQNVYNNSQITIEFSIKLSSEVGFGILSSYICKIDKMLKFLIKYVTKSRNQKIMSAGETIA